MAEVVRDRLKYQFRNSDGSWNIEKGLPCMPDLLRDVETLCELCLRQKDGSDLTPASGLTAEMKQRIANYLNFLGQLDQHNELSAMLGGLRPQCQVDVQRWIEEWHACECDFEVWYEHLPADLQQVVADYYVNRIKIRP